MLATVCYKNAGLMLKVLAIKSHVDRALSASFYESLKRMDEAGTLS